MKKVLGVVIMVLGSMMGYGQSPTWEWAHEGILSPSGAGDVTSMVSDDSGNVYMTGLYTDTIIFGSNSLISGPVEENAFLVKYNSSGNVVWATSSTSGVGIPYCISRDASDNIYMTGYFESTTITFGSFVLTNSGGSSIFFVKYNSAGTVLWAESIGGTGEDVGIGVCTDAIGNIYVTGQFSDTTLIFGTHTITNIGVYNIFLAKYDSSGNALWAKSAGGALYDEQSVVTCDPFGNVYITGSFRSNVSYFDSDSLMLTGDYSYFIAKYDASGNELWAKTAIGNISTYGPFITSDLNGNIFVTGSFNSSSIIFGSDTLTNSGVSYNTFIAKYDSLGNVLWARNSNGNSIGWFIITDISGNAYMTGYMADSLLAFDTITLHCQSNYDRMFFIKYESSGQAINGFVLPSAGDDYAPIAFGLSGSIYLGGDFTINPFILGNDSLIFTGHVEDPFIAKFHFNNLETSIPSHTLTPPQISLSPNPNNGTFTLACHLPNSQLSTLPSQFQIKDVSGRTLYSYNIDPSIANHQFSIPLTSGIYFWEVITKEERFGKGKLVIIDK